MNPKRGKEMRRDWDKIEKAKLWKEEAEQGIKKEMKRGKQKETKGAGEGQKNLFLICQKCDPRKTSWVLDHLSQSREM